MLRALVVVLLAAASCGGPDDCRTLGCPAGQTCAARNGCDVSLCRTPMPDWKVYRCEGK